MGILIFLFFLFPTISWGATYTAETCDNTSTHPHVQTEVNKTSDGDTVIVPAGSCTWDTALSVTKIIRIQGAGIGVTNITNGAAVSTTHLIDYNPTNITADYLFEITGFTWDLNGKSGISFTQTADLTAELKKTRIHHNTFINTSPSTNMMDITANFKSAVMDNNTFNGQVCFQTIGTGEPAWNNLTYSFGNGDGLYWEDNTYNISSSSCVNDGGRGSRWVNRYNTFILTAPASPLLDMHGNQTPAGIWGSMSGEIYGTTTTQSGSGALNSWFSHRGGKALMFYNKASNAISLASWIWEEYDDATQPVTKEGQFPQHVNDSYFWNNRNSTILVHATDISYSGTTTGVGANYIEDSTKNWNNSNFCDSGCADYIVTIRTGTGSVQTREPYPDHADAIPTTTKIVVSSAWSEPGPAIGSTYDIKFAYADIVHENTDYFNHQTSFDGTIGMGCGTLGNRPATCTTGVGYWATSQACDSVPAASIGANPTTPLVGTLYKCTSTDTWTAYYTPYTYPHPLRWTSTSTLSGSGTITIGGSGTITITP